MNFDNTIKIDTKTVATKDLIPSLTYYVKNFSLATTSTSHASVAGDTFKGVITFVNTMGLGTDTKGSRLILYPESTAIDQYWYGLGMAASKMVCNVSAATTHNFYVDGTQYVSISQGWTALNNALLHSMHNN